MNARAGLVQPLVCRPSKGAKRFLIGFPLFILTFWVVMFLMLPPSPDDAGGLVPPQVWMVIGICALLEVLLANRAFSRLIFTPGRVTWERFAVPDQWVDLESLTNLEVVTKVGKVKGIRLTDSSRRRIPIPLVYEWSHQEVWGPILVAALAKSNVECPQVVADAILGIKGKSQDRAGAGSR